MIKAIIIDDEQASRVALRQKIIFTKQEVEIIAEFQTAMEAIKSPYLDAADLVFLDVEMPGMSGFHFLDKIESRYFEVIITTAHHNYAVSAIRHSAIDFLLKPIDIEELKLALQRVTDKQKSRNTQQKNQGAKLNAMFDKIPIPSMRGLQFVPVKDILYLSSDGNYTSIVLDNKQKIVSSKNLGDYEDILRHLNFFRIHHSTMINLSQIKEYLKGDGGSVILTDGTELDVSKRRKKEFLEVIGL